MTGFAGLPSVFRLLLRRWEDEDRGIGFHTVSSVMANLVCRTVGVGGAALFGLGIFLTSPEWKSMESRLWVSAKSTLALEFPGLLYCHTSPHLILGTHYLFLPDFFLPFDMVDDASSSCVIPQMRRSLHSISSWISCCVSLGFRRLHCCINSAIWWAQ